MEDQKENIFLIGKPHHEIAGNQLPSNLEVLKFLFHNIRVLKHSLRVSESLVYDELITFWQKVKIPTQQKCRCLTKIDNLYNDWRNLQRNSSRRNDTQENNEKVFLSHLNNLFDIAHSNVLTMVDDNMKRFLLNQREPNRVGFIDDIEDISQKSESASQYKSSPSTSFSQGSLERDPSFVMDLDEESPPLKKSRGTVDILSTKLCTMLDKCKISDRNATGLLIAFLQAVNLDASDYIVNRTSIKQRREKFREERAAEIQARFTNKELRRLIVHWDGKHLPDITGRNFVERLPIIISSENECKVLSIPSLENATGRAMANAVFDALQEYGIGNAVVGLSCDTTASNTGEYNGAAVLIEQLLERDLLIFPCRHHIFEVILKAAFDSKLTNVSGPNVPIFARFKKEWDALDLTKFNSGIADPSINKLLETDIEDIHEFIKQQLTLNHDRKDYLELLELSSMFIGIIPENITFRVPGAMHQARWMAKAIYSLKIFLLRSTFKLKSTEEKSLAMICVFIVKIYIRTWFIATSSIKAPNCDFQLIKSIYNFQFIDKKISESALGKILNHLWYLNPENCLLALFDDNVDTETKKKMVLKLIESSHNADEPDLSESSNDRVSRKAGVSRADIPKILEKGLEQFVDITSINFHKLGLNTSWLYENCENWLEDSNYQDCLAAVENLSVVNDVVERGVKLMQEYNDLFTKDEEQKQFLIQILDDYRREGIKNTKESILKAWSEEI